MHVLVATAGALSPEQVVKFTRHLVGSSDSVTVLTVIEVPRSFLKDLESDDWNPLHDTEQNTKSDSIVDSYLRERGQNITDPLCQSLAGARIPYELLILEGGDPAETISSTANDLDVDVVLLGTTKQIFNHNTWESISARVMIESGRPVLVVPEERERDEDDTAYNPEIEIDKNVEIAEITDSDS